MSLTNHVQLTLIDSNQSMPDVTANAMAVKLEESAHKKLDVAMADSNQTLSDAQYNGYGVYKCTGALTAQRDLIVPTRQKRSVVINATSGGYGVQVKTASGTGVVIASGDSATCYSDGTNVIAFSGASSGGAVTSVFGRSGAVVAQSDDYAIADITGLQAELDKHGELVGINSQSGTSYTLVLADKGKLVSCSNASPIAVTIPTNASVAYPTGSTIAIMQGGAGKVTISPDVGVTLNKRSSTGATSGQYAVAQLAKTATNTWVLFGDLEA